MEMFITLTASGDQKIGKPNNLIIIENTCPNGLLSGTIKSKRLIRNKR
jgi:hypothetical protein